MAARRAMSRGNTGGGFARREKRIPGREHITYFPNEKDVMKLVSVLMSNTKGEKAEEDFLVKAETLPNSALIGYIYYELSSEKQNLSTLIALLNKTDVLEGDEDY